LSSPAGIGRGVLISWSANNISVKPFATRSRPAG
jgi:hypothetical protein